MDFNRLPLFWVIDSRYQWTELHRNDRRKVEWKIFCHMLFMFSPLLAIDSNIVASATCCYAPHDKANLVNCSLYRGSLNLLCIKKKFFGETFFLRSSFPLRHFESDFIFSHCEQMSGSMALFNFATCGNSQKFCRLDKFWKFQSLGSHTFRSRGVSRKIIAQPHVESSFLWVMNSKNFLLTRIFLSLSTYFYADTS